MPFPAHRVILNLKALIFLTGSFLVIFLAYDILLDSRREFPEQDAQYQERMKREAESTKDKGFVIDETMVHYEEEPSLVRQVRKILNESESFVEEGGTKRPISTKDLNKNYKEAKAASLKPKPDCIPKPNATDAAGGPPPADEDAKNTRRKRQTKKQLPFCDDKKKSA